MQGYLIIAGDAHELAIRPGFRLPDRRAVALIPADSGHGTMLEIGESSFAVEIAREGDHIWIHLDGRAHSLVWQEAVDYHAEEAGGSTEGVARAPMPGAVVAVAVAEGDVVKVGDALMLIESMKLETSIRAAVDGKVAVIHVALGDSFERDALLVTILPEA